MAKGMATHPPFNASRANCSLDGLLHPPFHVNDADGSHYYAVLETIDPKEKRIARAAGDRHWDTCALKQRANTPSHNLYPSLADVIASRPEGTLVRKQSPSEAAWSLDVLVLCDCEPQVALEQNLHL